MTFTDEQLANAAKALGVDVIAGPYKMGIDSHQISIWLTNKPGNSDRVFIHFGPGFAEWAIPILEERHGVIEGGFSDRAEITIWSVNNVWYVGIKWFLNHNPLPEIIIESGPDIDTATLLLAAKIGEGME